MGQFPKFQEITNILTAGRSRGVRMNMVVQGFDQLESAYGKMKHRQYDLMQPILFICFQKIIRL